MHATQVRARKPNRSAVHEGLGSQWRSPQTGLMYRTVPTAQGLRTEVFWADRFRGIRNQSGTTFDRLARHDHESLAQSSAVAQAMVRGFEDAYTSDIAKYNDSGRKQNGTTVLGGHGQGRWIVVAKGSKGLMYLTSGGHLSPMRHMAYVFTDHVKAQDNANQVARYGVPAHVESAVKDNNVLSIITLPDGKQSRKAAREAEKRLAAVNEAIDNSSLQPRSKTALRMELSAHRMVGDFADYVEKAKRGGAEERREFRAENRRSPDPTDFGAAEYRWPDVEYDVFPAGWVHKHDLNDAEVERIEEVIREVFDRAMLYGRPKKAARSR